MENSGMWKLELLERNAMELFPMDERTRAELQNLRSVPNLIHFMDSIFWIVCQLPIYNVVRCSCFKNKCHGSATNFFRRAEELLGTNTNHLMALECLTTAIAYVMSNSPLLAILYASRANMLYPKGYINESLEDINRAQGILKAKSFQNGLRNLQIRIRRDSYRLKTYIYHHPRPSSDPHVSFFNTSNTRLQPIQSRFHLFANKDVEIGGIVFTEEAFVQTYTDNHRLTHCHECLKLCYILMPCPECAESLYCSETCRIAAYGSYHQFECPLFQMGYAENTLFLKLALKSIIFNEHEHRVKKDMYLRKNGYCEMRPLQAYMQSKTLQELYRDSQFPLLFWHYLKRYTRIIQHITGENDEYKEQLLAELLLFQKMAVEMYQVEIYKIQGKTEKIKVADGIFRAYTRIHDSCTPNTFPVFYGNFLVLRAAKNIKVGEEIFVEKRAYKKYGGNLVGWQLNCRCDSCITRTHTSFTGTFAAEDLSQIQKISVRNAQELITEGENLYTNINKRMAEETYIAQGNRHLEF